MGSLFHDKEGRVCTVCKTYLAYSNFHRHAGCINGYNTVCKPCRRPLSKRQWKHKAIGYKMYSRCKSRATQKGLPFNLEEKDFIVPSHCPVFKIPFQAGYTKGNIQIISNKANRMKSNATLGELVKLVSYLKT